MLTARQLADTYGVTDTDGSRPHAWGLTAAHGWATEDPALIAQYR